MEMLETGIGDAQDDDPHQDNRLGRSPDHPCIRYETIDYPSNKTVLHFRRDLGD